MVLVGDLFYERPLAERVLAFVEAAHKGGAEVLVGDPRRSYFPGDRFRQVALYSVPVTRGLEDAEIKRSAVWRAGLTGLAVPRTRAGTQEGTEVGSLNYLPVLVAATVSFVFGGIWYHVFSKQWLEAVGRSPDNLHMGKSSIGLYLLAFGAQLVMAWMLAGVLLHLSKGGMTLGLRSGISPRS